MARNIGPKNRLARKTGFDLGLKTNSLKVARRLNIPPGMHGRKGKKKVSNYGEQLAEKQKVKFLYGILEKQMRKLYDKATKTPASTGKVLLSLLERRLDNAVYRLDFAPTMQQHAKWWFMETFASTMQIEHPIILCADECGDVD